MKSTLDDKLYFKVDLTQSQEANVYVRESRYSHYESPTASEPKVDKFFRVEKSDKVA